MSDCHSAINGIKSLLIGRATCLQILSVQSESDREQICGVMDLRYKVIKKSVSDTNIRLLVLFCL